MPQPSLNQLGAAIRSLREQRGLSIEALAHESDLHTMSVSRIEHGKQNPSWLALSRIADVLDVELLDLVRLAGERPNQQA